MHACTQTHTHTLARITFKRVTHSNTQKNVPHNPQNYLHWLPSYWTQTSRDAAGQKHVLQQTCAHTHRHNLLYSFCACLGRACLSERIRKRLVHVFCECVAIFVYWARSSDYRLNMLHSSSLMPVICLQKPATFDVYIERYNM